MDAKGKPPRLRRLRWLREIFLMTQPPLLAVMQGGEKERLIPGGHQTRPLPTFHIEIIPIAFGMNGDQAGRGQFRTRSRHSR